MSLRLLATLCGLIIVCFGCTKSSQSTSQTNDSQSAGSAEAQTSRDSSTPAAIAGATASSAALAVGFTDINGYDGAQKIKDVAALGILDSTSGAFRPNDSITRAEFARWLVKAQNKIPEPGYQLRLAQSGPATFSDVPVSNPDFPYIQGLANAGYVIGVDGSHFSPARPLTREQMIYLKAQVDERADIKTTGGAVTTIQETYSDFSKIGNKYIGAIYEDRSAGTTQTFNRVYQNTKTFGPQLPVTRGEAAIAVSEMKGEWPVTAAQALKRTPSP